MYILEPDTNRKSLEPVGVGAGSVANNGGWHAYTTNSTAYKVIVYIVDVVRNIGI